MRHKTQNTAIMTNTTSVQSYSNVLNMAFMLPVREQRQLIKDILVHVGIVSSNEAELHPFTWEELQARVREAEQQIARGEVFSEEESDRLLDEYLTNELGVEL